MRILCIHGLAIGWEDGVFLDQLRRVVAGLRSRVHAGSAMACLVGCLVLAVAAVAAVATAQGSQASRSAKVSAAPRGHSAPIRVLGEVVSRRTRFSRTYRRSDGSFELRVSAVPVNYRDPAGHWKPINNNLHQAQDGSWENSGGPMRVRIPATGGGSVSLAGSGRSLAFALRGGRGSARVHGGNTIFANTLPGVTTNYSVRGNAVRDHRARFRRNACNPYFCDQHAWSTRTAAAVRGDHVC